MNSVVIVGRVGQDPEIQCYESGKTRTTFSVAVNRYNAQTKKNDLTDWFNIQLWGKRAETASEWVKKGALVSIEGRIVLQKWTGQSGEEMQRFIINASDFGFVGSKKDSAQA